MNHNCIREVEGYQTSTDYKKLFELAKKQSVICLCRWGRGDHSCTDVAHTIFYKGTMAVSARGTGYVHADTLNDFITQCKECGLKWILPTIKAEL